MNRLVGIVLMVGLLAVAIWSRLDVARHRVAVGSGDGGAAGSRAIDGGAGSIGGGAGSIGGGDGSTAPGVGGGDRPGWLDLVPGGLRAWALAGAWLKADADLEQGRFDEFAADVRWIAQLQPDDEVALSYLAYQLTFTVSRYAADPAAEWEWLQEAIRLLENGLRRNSASSMLSAQLGEICLDILTRDPQLASAFEEWHGQPASEVALDSFTHARHLDEALNPNGGSSRWNSKVVLCLFLASQQRIRRGETEAGFQYLVRARDLLVESRTIDPDRFAAGTVGPDWLERVDDWIELAESLIRLEAIRDGRHPEAAGNREAVGNGSADDKESVLNLLERLRTRYPNDNSIVELQARLRDW